ncbi:MAG: hypothetical protein WA137_11600, partial [Methanothrix sp.]
LGDIGPIIISLDEITCCYLVKCKLVLATGYYYEIYNKTGTLPIFSVILDERHAKSHLLLFGHIGSPPLTANKLSVQDRTN